MPEAATRIIPAAGIWNRRTGSVAPSASTDKIGRKVSLTLPPGMEAHLTN